MANIEDFKKLEIRAGKILSAEKILSSEKLLKLTVDFGELGERQIIAGIAKYFPEVSVLSGRFYAFVTNLEPRSIMGLISQGMILACGDGETFSLLSIDPSVAPGSQVR